MDLIKRQTIQMTTKAHDKLGEYAKRFMLTRAEVLSAILENLDIELLAARLTAVREEKVGLRQMSTEERAKLRKLIKTITPEQLAAMMKQAGIDA